MVSSLLFFGKAGRFQDREYRGCKRIVNLRFFSFISVKYRTIMLNSSCGGLPYEDFGD